MKNALPVTVRILDKEYHIACPPEERDALLAAAEHLNRKMRDIRDSGRVVGAERLAVIAALNITHELLTSRSDSASVPQHVNDKLQRLQSKIDSVLSSGHQSRV
ncbi:MAG TPA: cell division protein ZapA [Gammaproteobacteria bacterium]|nr:cell division protein ZapA [Gammaproteobacteria bacterium]